MNNIILLDLSERIKAAIDENQDNLDAIISTLAGMGSGGIQSMSQLFTEGGAWTRPHSGVGLVWALLVGAGGAGYRGTTGTGGCGGGGGEVVFQPVPVNSDLTITVGQGASNSNGGNSSISGLVDVIAYGGAKAAAYNWSSAGSYGAGGCHAGYGGAPSTIYGPWGGSRSGGGDGSQCADTYGHAPGSCLGYGSPGTGHTTTDDYGAPGGGSFNNGASRVTSGDGQTPSGFGGGASGSSPYSTKYAAGASGMVFLTWFE